MKKTFYSNGKLLLTGEYLVLDGAKALALPTKFGQDLTVEPGNDNEIHWTSYDHDGSFWFDDAFRFSEIESKTSYENQPIRNMLISILHEAYLLNANFLKQSEGYTVTTKLTFPKYWGLGTSSTLINNIAQWLDINAYTLLQKTFGGSGYDIACAQHDTPITYQLIEERPVVKAVRFEPDCANDIYFVYLNQKQNSKSAIASYYAKSHTADISTSVIDKITDSILQQNDFEYLSEQLQLHEMQLSKILELPKVGETLFADFKGTVKSLGAWGGDFILVMSKENPSGYFRQKGYDTILPYSEMIL